jgi:pimeloyl-ACP methyl ester carboxylesterase
LRDVAAARIKGVDIVDLPAGHSVNLEQGERFEQEVLDWLSRRNLA